MGNCFVENQGKQMATPQKQNEKGENRFSLFNLFTYKEREQIRLQSEKIIENF